MPAFKKISITPLQFFEEIVKPSFGDLIPDTAVNSGYFGEFVVMDDVPNERKILDITPVSNIIKRRDASCKIVFSPVGKADVRRISTTDLYAATEFCAQEFYQGCLKDWKKGDASFVPRIFEFFRKAIRRDMVGMLYFGDVNRVDANGASWNTNKFDGVYTQYLKYVNEGLVPAAQTFNVPSGAMTAANSVVYLEQAYNAQDEFMDLLDDSEKAFYIDRDWAKAYESYLISTGTNTANLTEYTQNGVKVVAYKGIPVFTNPVFKPILKQITGVASHLGILTLRGNFIFATDSSYGAGPNEDQALTVWYDWHDLTWKWLNVLKAGTQIALPEHSVLALPA